MRKKAKIQCWLCCFERVDEKAGRQEEQSELDSQKAGKQEVRWQQTFNPRISEENRKIPWSLDQPEGHSEFQASLAAEIINSIFSVCSFSPIEVALYLFCFSFFSLWFFFFFF